MHKRLSILGKGLLILSLVSLACSGSRQEREPKTLVGTMHSLSIEGGCWYLQTENGKKYELIGEKVRELKKEGLKVEVAIQSRPDLASICMVGEIVELVEIIQIY